MDADEQPGRADADRTTAFTTVLSELKRRGSALLLVGPAQHRALSVACQRLLGDPGERRRRLFVLTDEDPSTHAGVRSLGGPGARTSRVLSYATPTRSAAATAGDAVAVPTRRVEGDLDALLAAVGDAVEEMDAERGGFEPAELRVCLDSLDALLAAHDDEAVFEFLHGVVGVTNSVDAMCHVHLPTALDSEATRLVSPLFDAVIEVRDGTQPRQRWHVPDADLTTDWLVL